MACIYPSSPTLVGHIYCVTCLDTQKQYIGQTRRDVTQRWHQHVTLATRRPLYAFHRAIAKYGADRFRVDIIETAPVTDLDAREQYWIATRKTEAPLGYNSTPGGNSNVNPLRDLTGQQFGQWTVLYQDTPTTAKPSRTYWRCRCTCGTELVVQGLTLTSGRSTKCRTCSKNAPVDMTGEQINDWTVLGRAPGTKARMWLCRCVCGYEQVIAGGRLRHANPQSCRQCADRRKMGLRLDDLTGRVFGQWTVESRDLSRMGNGSYWWCRCACGKVKSVAAGNMKNGSSTRCRSCARRENYEQRGGIGLPSSTS